MALSTVLSHGVRERPSVEGGPKVIQLQQADMRKADTRLQGHLSMCVRTHHTTPSSTMAVSPTSHLQHLLGLIDSRGTWTLVRESSGPFMGLPWDWKAGGWKRGLPGPVEKVRRGLAGVEVGSSGEVVVPEEKQEETGFTKPEVLGSRKKVNQRVGQSCWANPSLRTSRTAMALSHPKPQLPALTDRTQKDPHSSKVTAGPVH